MLVTLRDQRLKPGKLGNFRGSTCDEITFYPRGMETNCYYTLY